MAAGIATLDALGAEGVYERLEERSADLEAGLAGAIADAGVPACVQRVGSMLSLFLRAAPVTDFASARLSDLEAFGRFFSGMLEQGVYLAPSPFEAWFVSLAHSRKDIARTVDAARNVMKRLAA
jgi:glutamate-1-semialdehyde 2,1-aminomutase